MEAAWSVTPEKVSWMIERIIHHFHPRKLVLFGSFVTGELHRHSDIDVLVVTRGEIENPRKESVRIRRSLKGINMSIDIIVVSETDLRTVADSPGMIYREALKTGKVVYESAA